MRLEDTAAVVTGASSGLGKAMARAFASEGADVVCAALDDERLSEAVREIAGAGDATGVGVDVRSWEEVQALAESARDAYGEIDVLVNAAGVNQRSATGGAEPRPVVDLPVEVWDAVVDTNLRGVFLCTKAFLPGMIDRGAGRLIHISSSQGTDPRPRRAPYGAAKHGVFGLHGSLARELEGTGVSTTTLRPPEGGVLTEIRRGAGRDLDTFRFDDPGLMGEPAVRLAAGEGENGGRYVTTEDGTGLEVDGPP